MVVLGHRWDEPIAASKWYSTYISSACVPCLLVRSVVQSSQEVELQQEEVLRTRYGNIEPAKHRKILQQVRLARYPNQSWINTFELQFVAVCVEFGRQSQCLMVETFFVLFPGIGMEKSPPWEG